MNQLKKCNENLKLLSPKKKNIFWEHKNFSHFFPVLCEYVCDIKKIFNCILKKFLSSWTGEAKYDEQKTWGFHNKFHNKNIFFLCYILLRAKVIITHQSSLNIIIPVDGGLIGGLEEIRMDMEGRYKKFLNRKYFHVHFIIFICTTHIFPAFTFSLEFLLNCVEWYIYSFHIILQNDVF